MNWYWKGTVGWQRKEQNKTRTIPTCDDLTLQERLVAGTMTQEVIDCDNNYMQKQHWESVLPCIKTLTRYQNISFFVMVMKWLRRCSIIHPCIKDFQDWNFPLTQNFVLEQIFLTSDFEDPPRTSLDNIPWALATSIDQENRRMKITLKFFLLY